MFLLLFLFGLALSAPSDLLGAPSDNHQLKLQRGNCPMFWFSFRNRCYKYVATDMTWADAELHCLSEGANLVSIHSLDENAFVKSLIRNFDPAEGRTWFGLSDLHKEGRWMSSDGCPVKFVHWQSGQPNGAATQNCGQYNYVRGWDWNDYECSTLSPFVCATRIMCP